MTADRRADLRASTPTASPVAAERARASGWSIPGFGRVFTDHMVTIRYNEAEGWHDCAIAPRAPLTVDPACAVLHYAQEIFEGLKAYRTRRWRHRAVPPRRQCPPLPAIARGGWRCPNCPRSCSSNRAAQLVASEIATGSPTSDGGSLYLRPFMIASEAFLGVKPSSEYIYMVIASSVGAYFKGGAPRRSRSGRRRTTPAPRPAGRARPNAAAITPPAWPRRPRRSARAAIRSCSSTRSSAAMSRNWAA